MRFFVLVLFMVVLKANGVLACSTCYGNPEHLMSKGLTAGVSLLLGTIFFVLCFFASFFVFLMMRIKKTNVNNG